MKNILMTTIITLTFSNPAMASLFNVYVKADSPEALQDKIEQTIPKVLSGEITAIGQSACFPNDSRYLKMLDVDLSSGYTIEADHSLKSIYKAKINYKHTDCKKK